MLTSAAHGCGSASSSRERAEQIAHRVLEDRAHQRVPVREVPVERADADARAPRHVLQGRVRAVLGERRTRLGEQSLVVPAASARMPGRTEAGRAGLVVRSVPVAIVSSLDVRAFSQDA